MSDGGKGSERRKGADDNAYRSGYDRIFGAKPKPTEAVIPASVKKKERKEKSK